MAEENRAVKIKKMCGLLVKTASTITEQTRTPYEENLLFRNLINFNGVPVGVNSIGNPGTFGNRCRACGHSFGDGFHCSGCGAEMLP